MYSILLLADLGLMNTLFMSIIFLVIIWYLKWRRSRQHLYEAAKKVGLTDCQKELPILGHSLYYVGDAERIMRNLHYVSSKSSATPVGFWLAHRLFFCLNTPEQMEAVLSSPKCLEKDDLYRFSKPLGGNGLFSLDVKTWKVHRKLIMPSLNQRILDKFVDVFVERSNVLINDVLSKKVGELFDVEESITVTSLEIITQTAMGMKCADSESIRVLFERITRAFEILYMRMFNVHLHFDFIFNLTKLSNEQKYIVDFFKNFIRSVYYEKKEEFLQKKEKVEEAQIDECKQRKVFLDHLIEVSQLTDEEIINEVQTFMIGGSDTSATVVSFVLICLGIFPEYQQKVYDEIVDVVGLERNFECTDIPKLKYLEKFVKETMRLFPIGPFIIRKVTEDMEVDGHVLPKDSGLFLCIFTIHRNEKYYPNPMKFDPERFSPEEIAKRHPYAYLPFSAGPRNCIGMKFGMIEVKTIVATVARRYFIETSFKSVEDVRLKQSFILKSCLSFPIKLTERVAS
ncbi:PREDICTED: cytochrome P450 4C1-like [Nicrophorus vespilloides]|uniref:Cytochrome P450 4C1-like n=1 Tax=Nicrophorus vespilloides TaxID=110193 RepID=A0ABM1MPF3_NICVS|nr:PREDICTED: cytochrome P450 4C1-like [Nicrophorus vespilloides]